MADDILARVFEPFTQADGGYDRGYEGAGLGLSIVKRLVELMGGNISMASEPGVGTEAYFSVVFGLPQVAGQSRQAEEAAALGPEGRRILLVEDDLMSRNALARLLAKKGHGVTSVENGKLALEALAREPFDLVLMDVKMPVMDGSEATRRIRSDTSGRFDPGIPVIAVTAYAMDGDRERFLAEGMDDYVAKPVDAKELDAAIERATAGGKAPWERPNRRADG
jgi:CheY-like chemotaxis protein